MCDLMAQYGVNKPNLNTPIDVKMVITPPDRRKRDIDNICKTLWDALTLAGMWTDDRLIHNLHISISEPCKPGWVDMEVTAREV